MRSQIFLARHGETDWNRAGRWQGHTDIPLNERGRTQARELAIRLRYARIRSIISSDLARARDTAEIVAAELGVEVAYFDADLRERSFGCFEGLTRSECEQRYPDLWRAWVDRREAPPGGEPSDGVPGRIIAAVMRVADRICGSAAQMQAPPLVITHGGVLRAFMANLTGAPVAPVPNVGVYRVAFDGANLVPVGAASHVE